MINEPMVYIILVNYNGFKETAACIESILECSYDNFKIVTVDNNSTKIPDSSIIDYIKDNSIYLSSEKNDGYSAGNNIGIEYALKHGAEYVYLLNNDTVVEKDFLTQAVRCSREHNNAIIASKINFFKEKNLMWYGGGQYNFKKGYAVHEDFKKIDDGEDHLHEVTFGNTCGMLFPIKVIKYIGLMDETFFLYAEDLEYSLRASVHYGYKIIYCGLSLVFHKINSSTKKMSVSSLYYIIRNNIRVANEYSTGLSRGKIHWLVYTLKRVIKRELPISLACKAYLDGIRCVVGKYQDK